MRAPSVVGLALAVALAAGLPGSARAGWARTRVTNPDGSFCGSCPQLFWCHDRKVTYTLNQAGSKDAGVEPSLRAARTSFATWSSQTCTDFEFVDGGTTSRFDIGYNQGSKDNLNLVVWREQSCSAVRPGGDPCIAQGNCNNVYDCWENAATTIALTTTTYNNKTGQILDADIELNGAGFVFTTVDSPICPNPPPAVRPLNCVAVDIQNTITHEAGHVLGLDHPDLSPEASVDHTNDRLDTMYSEAPFGETRKRTLEPDDIAGLCAIYPKGVETAGCTNDVTGECGCGIAGTPQGGVGLVLLALLWLSRRTTSPPTPLRERRERRGGTR